MQLCQIHFYQKIARKKVARVNAAKYTEEWYELAGPKTLLSNTYLLNFEKKTTIASFGN